MDREFESIGASRSVALGAGATAVIEKIIASNASKIAEVLVLIAEHEVHHTLMSEA
ncbi:hypothetical protein D9M71_621620 [compost metagenome]